MDQGQIDWAKMQEAWEQTQFSDIDVNEMDDKVQRFGRMCFKVERGLPSNKVVPKLRDLVEEFKKILPVVRSLRNDALKERHWTKIKDMTGHDLAEDKGLTLGNMLEMKVTDHMEAINTISTEATQEAALEELLAKVQAKWTSVEFQVRKRRTWRMHLTVPSWKRERERERERESKDTVIRWSWLTFGSCMHALNKRRFSCCYRLGIE